MFYPDVCTRSAFYAASKTFILLLFWPQQLYCNSILAQTTWSKHRPHKWRWSSSIRQSPLQTLPAGSGSPRSLTVMTNWGKKSHNPTSFENSLEQCTECRKGLYLQLRFYVKGNNSGSLTWRYWGKRLGGSQAWRAPCPLLMASGHITLLVHQGTLRSWCINVFINQEVPLTFSGQSFDCSFTRCNWWNHWHVIELHLYPAPSPHSGGQADPKSQLSTHVVGLSGGQFPSWSSLGTHHIHLFRINFGVIQGACE